MEAFKPVWIKMSDHEMVNMAYVTKIRHDATLFRVYFHHPVARAAGITGSDGATQVIQYANDTDSQAGYDELVAQLGKFATIVDPT